MRKRKWLIEFEETPLVETIDKTKDIDVIESKEEMLGYINAWLTDDPKRAQWLKAVDAVLVQN